MAFPELVELMDRAVQGHLGGGTVRYAPSLGDAVDIQGLFVAEYVRADAGQAGVATTSPAVFLRVSDLPSSIDTDDPIITAGGVVWKVSEAKKDDQGGVLIFLHRA